MTMTLDDVTAKLLEYMARQDAIISMMEAYTGGVVGGGPNGDGKYPLPSGPGTTRLITCPAQIAFDAARMQIVLLTGSNNLTLVAAHNGCKVLVSNATNAINLTIGADIRPGFSCLIEQYNIGKIHFLPGASAVLRPRLTGYEYTAGRYGVAGVSCDERNSSGTNMINLYGDLTNVA